MSAPFIEHLVCAWHEGPHTFLTLKAAVCYCCYFKDEKIDTLTGC